MRRRRNTSGNESYAAYWIMTAAVVAFLMAMAMTYDDDSGAYLKPCPRGTAERTQTMCFP